MCSASGDMVKKLISIVRRKNSVDAILDNLEIQLLIQYGELPSDSRLSLHFHLERGLPIGSQFYPSINHAARRFSADTGGVPPPRPPAARGVPPPRTPDVSASSATAASVPHHRIPRMSSTVVGGVRVAAAPAVPSPMDDASFIYATEHPHSMQGITWIAVPTRLFDKTQDVKTRRNAIAQIVRRATADPTAVTGKKRKAASEETSSVATPAAAAAACGVRGPAAPAAAARVVRGAAAPAAPGTLMICCVCMTAAKECMIDCAHVSMCMVCAVASEKCPICRRAITKRISVQLTTPYEKRSLITNDDAMIPLCVQCGDEERNCVLNCGHALRCITCVSSATHCLTCKQAITSRDCIVTS